MQDYAINDYKMHCWIKYSFCREKEIMILNIYIENFSSIPTWKKENAKYALGWKIYAASFGGCSKIYFQVIQV